MNDCKNLEPSKPVKVGIIGSRNTRINQKTFNEIIGRQLYFIQDYMIITGGAKGIDTMAELYAKENLKPLLVIKPDYSRYGRYAPLKRNEDIVNQSDLIIAIWNGISRGTLYTINKAKEKRKEVLVIYDF